MSTTSAPAGALVAELHRRDGGSVSAVLTIDPETPGSMLVSRALRRPSREADPDAAARARLVAAQTDLPEGSSILLTRDSSFSAPFLQFDWVPATVGTSLAGSTVYRPCGVRVTNLSAHRSAWVRTWPQTHPELLQPAGFGGTGNAQLFLTTPYAVISSETGPDYVELKIVGEARGYAPYLTPTADTNVTPTVTYQLMKIRDLLMCEHRQADEWTPHVIEPGDFRFEGAGRCHETERRLWSLLVYTGLTAVRPMTSREAPAQPASLERAFKPILGCTRGAVQDRVEAARARFNKVAPFDECFGAGRSMSEALPFLVRQNVVAGDDFPDLPQRLATAFRSQGNA